MNKSHFADDTLRVFTQQRFKSFFPLIYIVVLTGLTLGYFWLAKLGLLLATYNQNVPPVWPATGFGLAIVTLLGGKFWPAIFIGTFAAHYNVADMSWQACVVGGLANSLEAYVGARLFVNIRRTGWFVTHGNSFATIAASLGGSGLGASFGVLGLHATKYLSLSDLPSIWSTWWVGDIIGGLTVFPLLCEVVKVRSIDIRSILSSLHLILLGLCVAYFIFMTEIGGGYLFLIFPYILLCLYQSGSLGAYLASFGFGSIGIAATYFGYGIFQSGNLNSDLIHLQIFLASLSITTLFLPELWRHGSNKPTAIVLMSSWILAAGIFHSFYSKGRVEIEMEFSNAITAANERLNSQADHYLTALKSGIGLFKASESVSRTEWRAFVDETNMVNTRSGLKGLGVVFRMPIEDVPQFTAMTRLDGAPDFSRQPVEAGESIVSPEAYLVTYVEPFLPNLWVLGLDIATEKHRKTAADLAMRSGEVVWTEAISLVQEKKATSGFLVLHPIYKNNQAQNDEESRIKNHVGWVYCAINANEFFSAALRSNSLTELSYAVHEVRSNKLLSQSPDFFASPNGAKHLRRVVNIQIAGKEFYLTVRPSPRFSTSVDLASSFAGAIAALVGLLLAGLVSSMQTTNERVENLVQERSRELELTSRMAKVGGWSFNPFNFSLTLSPIAKEMLALGRHEEPTADQVLGFIRDSALKSQISKIIADKDFTVSQWDSVLDLIDELGRVVWVRVIGMRGPSPQGPDSYYGTIQDITEQKQRELMLMQSSKMASLGEMAAGVAHEVNNPLMIISGMAYRVKLMVGKGSINPAFIHNEMEAIDATVKRIANIVRGLRAFSRNADADPFEEVSLKTVIDETLVLCVERFKNRGVRFEVDPVPDINLRARSTQISQVLLNLLNNSYDSISETPASWVNITFFRPSSHSVEIRVTDSGPGIPPAIAEKIMQPFFSTKEVGKGTGLGLSISKGIALSHGGDLRLDMTAKNTSFILTLPLDPEKGSA